VTLSETKQQEDYLHLHKKDLRRHPAGGNLGVRECSSFFNKQLLERAAEESAYEPKGVGVLTVFDGTQFDKIQKDMKTI
jgi:hypothetical protein